MLIRRPTETPYQNGLRTGRNNWHTSDRNYVTPESWIAWLAGWRAGQRERRIALAVNWRALERAERELMATAQRKLPMAAQRRRSA